MSNKIKVCSLFSGIGGFETGIFNAFGEKNVEVVFASEIDKYANLSYEIIYNHKPKGDITKISEKEVPNHDLLVGGFPCQSFSMAGKRLGINDARGTMFFEIARILKEKKPKNVLLENVKGLLMHDKGKTFQIIVEILSDLGYCVDFTILNSKNFNVPQSRERVYIVGAREVMKEKWDFDKVKGLVHRTKKELLKKGNINTFNFDFPINEKTNKNLRDLLEKEVEEKYYLTTEKEKEVLSRNKREKEEHLKMSQEKNLKLVFFDGVTEKPNWLDNGKRYSRNYKQGSRIYNSIGLASTLSASGTNGYYLTEDWRIRKLTPLECFRMQSFPDNYYYRLKEKGVSDRQLYKMAGNAVTTNVIKEIASKFVF